MKGTSTDSERVGTVGRCHYRNDETLVSSTVPGTFTKPRTGRFVLLFY
jgi:hypothetical protein